ncbi:probable polygalacturonase At1g80170 isoform X2 [Malania oleifera]|uniref:probable polygalacturonase At1g80170 isoform X2 n=1 Tax=Malania oleifera TaxID=397392 RepID=UPI0025AE08C6|nr:probable polygalacturonase At1g80170 isoform X2 [Malania oleifera]
MRRRSSSLQLAGGSVIVIYAYLVANLTSVVESFEPLIQLPRSGSFRNRPRYERVVNVRNYGAKGDGLSDDTQAFEDAWKIACSLPLRTSIVIPSGYTYLVRPIDFAGPCRSRVTLRICGIVIAPSNPDVWDGLDTQKWLYFHGVNRLTVEGGGTIDGRGQEWWSQSCKINKTNPCRHAPTAITFHRCKNLKFKNLMVKNSQQMHIGFTNCVRVIASFLKVFAPPFSPNTDGIHISASTRVEVKDSIIRTGDDCISIVSNSSGIKIRNIVCGPGHGISIGSLGKSNSWAQVHDVRVDGAFLSNTQNGVRVKTWQGGRGFASNIIFQNVRMENVSNPIIINQYYCDSVLPCANQTSAVKVENISFKHIKGTSATEEAMRFACSNSFPCERIFLEDIMLVSPSGEIPKSFCWEAHGSTKGVIYPSPCFSCSGSFSEQKARPSFVLHSVQR